MNNQHKAGFVNIFGPPNAGKSTLLNDLIGETLAITSPKVQTTRQRIIGIITEPDYQLVFSDTPGIIDPKYKLHSKMMQQVKSAIEDCDVALLMADATETPEQFIETVQGLKIKAPIILLLNKLDLIKDAKQQEEIVTKISTAIKPKETIVISALKKVNTDKIVPSVLKYMPTNPPFFPEDDISDRPTRFFVSELVRQQVYNLYEKEIPYHTAVIIQSFEEKPNIVKIQADIIVSRETQKLILLGPKGGKIKQLGINARQKIEEFLGQKVFLELFVKVRPKWRDNDLYLKEYGY